jgi:hypothetical protein
VSIPRIVGLTSTGEAQPTPIDPARILGGEPTATVDHRYSSDDARFHAGIWTSSVGRWRVSYTEHEYCLLTRGRVRLQSDDGVTVEYAAGDAFVIPSGFSGTWETLEDCAKHYVIYEPA